VNREIAQHNAETAVAELRSLVSHGSSIPLEGTDEGVSQLSKVLSMEDTSDLTTRLGRLAEMFERGLLSEEEFKLAKSKLLSE
jgi:hypothetical protein